MSAEELPSTNPIGGSQGSDFVDGFLRSPLSGIAPWVLMAILSGPGRFAEAAAGALGLTLVVLWAGGRRGIRVHSLDVFGAVVFAIFVGLGILGDPGLIKWLELWAGELTNAALAAFSGISLLIRRPFTMAYARDTVDEVHWRSPLFIRVNYVLTAVWASAFLLNGFIGAVGNSVLHDGDNFWTGWIFQLAAMLAAVGLTEFYPDYARAQYLAAMGEETEAPPSLARAMDWLPPFVVAIGIAGWATDSLPIPVNIGFIAIGIVAGILMKKYFPGSLDKSD